MALFNSYRESIIIKDHVKSKHIIAGDHSYYSGYYHGKPFEECVMYLDEVDNSADPENIDQLIIGKFFAYHDCAGVARNCQDARSC